MIYHVLSRGNGRMRLFHKAEDYDAFERVIIERGFGVRPSSNFTRSDRKAASAQGSLDRPAGVLHVDWDPSAFKARNCSVADEYIRRDYRKGFSIH